MNNLKFEELPAAVGNLTEKIDRILTIISNPKPQDPSDTWLDVPALVKYVPGGISKPTIYRQVHNRTIPFHKKLKKLYFLQSEIDAWIRSGRKDEKI
jgi:predicted DNA-binding transcriptional regulator AlpA